MKKINKKTHFLPGKYAVLLLAVLFACTQDLDLKPRTQISEKNFWKQANDFKQAANRYYVSLLPQHVTIGGIDDNSDLTYGTEQNVVGAGVNVAGENDGIWNSRYVELRQINTMLAKAAEYPGDKSEIATSVAEGKFFRALAYFQLVVRFGDVPYFDRPLTGLDDELLKKPRASRETVITNVLKDLDEAAPDLPLQSKLSGTDIGRVTQGAAYALKARVALFEATWAKYHGTPGNVNALLDQSIAAARAVMSSGEYELFEYAADKKESYLQSYMLPGNDSKEQILARRYHPEVGGHALGHWLCCGNFGDGTKKLADMYVCTDGLPISKSKLFKGYGTMTSEYKNRDLRMSNTFTIPGSTGLKYRSRDNADGNQPVFSVLTTAAVAGYKVRKLVAVDEEGFVWGQCSEFKHVLKYSEVLLNLAEALFEKSGAISDGDLDATINKLRARGGVARLTNALVSANGLDMKTEIRRERAVELAYDNHRLNDLKRWKMAVKELNEDIKGVNIGGGAWDNAKDKAGKLIFKDISKGKLPKDADGFKIVEPKANRKFSEKNYLFPLPTQQIQLSNGVLTQNTGW